MRTAGSETPPDEVTVLRLPAAERVQFERNFITSAVCELRFPILLEYESAPPVQLQKLLRKKYPIYSRQRETSIGPGEVEHKYKFLFRSRKPGWAVAFGSSSIALETNRYLNFEDFENRLTKLLDQTAALIDSDFFTRVGLRYINEIPLDDGNLDGWVRDELVSPLATGIYGRVDQFFQEIRGHTEIGGYSFRHGIARSDNGDPVYQLDYDLFKENVSIDAVKTLITHLNELSFKFFYWSIGPQSREVLGEARPKD